MNDTFVNQGSQHWDKFLQHFNFIDRAIPFTAEDMLFFDIIITPKPDGTLTTGVYRKPTHTYQYLQWGSHHHIAAKTMFSTHSLTDQMVVLHLNYWGRKYNTYRKLYPNVNTLNSTYDEKKNVWRFCLVIGSFSLRAMYL